MALSADARTVLQAVEDLQFTGRPYRWPEGFASEPSTNAGDLAHFDPVPLAAIHGELSPFAFDLDEQLRLLETEQALTHAVGPNMQCKSFVRPDGKIVVVGWAPDEQTQWWYFADVDGQRVHGIETSDDAPGSLGIDSYAMTELGRAILRKADED